MGRGPEGPSGTLHSFHTWEGLPRRTFPLVCSSGPSRSRVTPRLQSPGVSSVTTGATGPVLTWKGRTDHHCSLPGVPRLRPTKDGTHGRPLPSRPSGLPGVVDPDPGLTRPGPCGMDPVTDGVGSRSLREPVQGGRPTRFWGVYPECGRQTVTTSGGNTLPGRNTRGVAVDGFGGLVTFLPNLGPYFLVTFSLTHFLTSSLIPLPLRCSLTSLLTRSLTYSLTHLCAYSCLLPSYLFAFLFTYLCTHLLT